MNSKLVLGKEYRHVDGRYGELVAPHPHDGALLVMNETRREDDEILVFFGCEHSDLVELEPSAAPKCSVCGEPQAYTPGGLCCANGHGGADSV